MINIREHIHRALLEYSKDASRLLSRCNKNLDTIPLILVGDLNINSAVKKSETLLQYLLE